MFSLKVLKIVRYKFYLFNLGSLVNRHPANLLELSRKVLVGEIWRVIVFHELDHLRLDSVWAFPVTPEPF